MWCVLQGYEASEGEIKVPEKVFGFFYFFDATKAKELKRKGTDKDGIKIKEKYFCFSVNYKLLNFKCSSLMYATFTKAAVSLLKLVMPIKYLLKPILSR